MADGYSKASSRLWGSAALVAMVAAAAGAPQGAMAAEAVEASSAPVIGEVVVTAQRREENVQKVPIAITVLSSEAIEKKNVADFHDLNKVAPGLSVNNGGSDRNSLNFVMRGLGVASNSGSDPAVIVYFSDVPTVSVGPGSIYDLENIQILKGPQGTLFGKNTTAGAILLQPAKPTEEFGGNISVSVGDYSLVRGQGAINVPIVADKLLTRLAFDVNKRKGFTTNVHNGEDLDDVNYQSFRFSTTFKPVDRVEDRLILDYTHSDTNGAGLIIGDLNTAAGFAALFNAPTRVALRPAFLQLFADQAARGPRKVNYRSPNFNEFTAYNLTNTLNVDLTDNISLKNIIGYRVYRVKVAQDVLDLLPTMLVLGIPASPFWDSGTFGPPSSKAFTIEQQIQGSSSDERLSWIVGGFYGRVRPYAQDQQSWTTSLGLAPAITAVRRNDTTKALYTQVSYNLTEKLKLTGGVRYTWDDRDFWLRRYNGAPGTGAFVACTFVAALINPACLFDKKLSFAEPTWNVDLSYQATPDTMLYATVRRGYRSGGFNNSPANNNRIGFEPEFDTSYEVGVKSSFMIGDMATRANLSLYDNFFRDLQENSQAFDPSTNTIFGATVNAGKGYYRGAELELTIAPSRNFTVSGYWAYLEAKYTENLIQTLAPPAPPTDLSRTPFQNAPKHKFGINGEYTVNLPGDAGDLSFSADFTYQSRVLFLEPLVVTLTNPNRGQDGYGLLNLRMDWRRVFGSSVDANLFVTNVTDKLYKVHQSDQFNGSTGFSQSIYGAPRMFGGGLKYSF